MKIYYNKKKGANIIFNGGVFAFPAPFFVYNLKMRTNGA